jgi:hypothetical protein
MPVTMTPAIIYFPVTMTPVNSFSPVSLTLDVKHKVANILVIFLKKIEMAPIGHAGAVGKLIREKNLKLKISCQTPFQADLRM